MDIFNIFNDREDVKVQGWDKYPEWVRTVHRPKESYGQLALTFIYGKGIERATYPQYTRFRRLHRVLDIRAFNARLRKNPKFDVQARPEWR